MNIPLPGYSPLLSITIPEEFESLSAPPLLLPGEELAQYCRFRDAIFAQLAPQSAIEWLLAIDIAESSWEIRRYRVLRHKVLEAYRQKAIEMTLRRVDVVGVAQNCLLEAEFHTLQNALSWSLDENAASEIEARLASYGFDQDSISMEVYVQAREIFVLFENLLNGAQMKRLLLLRDVHNRRTKYQPGTQRLCRC